MKLFVIKNVNCYHNTFNLDINNICNIKNSLNSNIIFNNKFNKLIIEKCNSLYIELPQIITSIEINNSNNIFIKLNNNNKNMIPCIELYKSTLYIIGNIDLYNDTLIISESSNLNHLSLKE